jgi:hypothetical protein
MYHRNSEYELLAVPTRRDNRSRTSNYSDLNGEDYEWHEDMSKREVGYISSAFIITYLLIFFALSTAVVAAIVFIKTRHKSGSLLSNQSITLFTDQCNSSLHTYNLIGHFIINFLGTIVLASSNYLQQICSSPTLDVIKKRIEKGKDLKFGSNSPSSVFSQKKTLTLLWLSLLLTSLPLHIMINGILGYAVHSINSGCQAIQAKTTGETATPSYASNWTIVPSQQCAQLLLSSIAFVTDFKNITIVVNPNSVAPFTYYDNYFSQAGIPDSPYIPKASDISICYTDSIISECQLTVRWFPLLCAAGGLFLKATIAFFGLSKHSHFHRRIFNSLGDMIAVGARHPNLRKFARDANMFKGEPCRELKIRWKQALGGWDFLVAMFWWISSLGVLGLGMYEFMKAGGVMTWSDRYKRFGLGTIDPTTSIIPNAASAQNGDASTFPIQIIIANCPQLWLSIGYILWNNQITRIWMEREWRSFYGHRLKPRVSYPLEVHHAGVTATRWLQLPYWLTFVLMALNTVLHWLVSQTLFVVEILANSEKAANFYLNFSPLAIFSIGLASTILVLGMTIFYFVPIKTWMPLMAGSLRIVLESCLHLPPQRMMDGNIIYDVPDGGVMFGDISTEKERLAGFGVTAQDLVQGATYPSDRELEPLNLRARGSRLSLASTADRVPLLRARRYEY